jgi:acyl carrier protein phosphodiesterase
MNFLAHIYLSGENDLLKIGNFMADSVRGNDYLNYQEDIKKGKDLYSKEFDELEDREIREFVRKYPMEKVLSYYLKSK